MTEDQQTDEPKVDSAQAPEKDPVRSWTIRILVLCVVLLFAYLVADRITPYSSQARVHALVVPIAAEVSGSVAAVNVGNSQPVAAGHW